MPLLHRRSVEGQGVTWWSLRVSRIVLTNIDYERQSAEFVGHSISRPSRTDRAPAELKTEGSQPYSTSQVAGGLVLPERLESVGRHFGIANGMGYILMAQVVL
jgi:hypothetical protein